MTQLQESNLGKWDGWHDSPAPRAFGNTSSYALGAEWLKDCSLVEDWACGSGFFSTFVPKERYRGLDGSRTRFADEIVDLADYRSEVPGIFVRHLLEHSYRWQDILDNATASFTERMFLVLFTPLVDETHDTEFEDPPGVPNLAFRLEDLTDRMAGVEVEVEALGNAIPYGLQKPPLQGTETIFRLAR